MVTKTIEMGLVIVSAHKCNSLEIRSLKKVSLLNVILSLNITILKLGSVYSLKEILNKKINIVFDLLSWLHSKSAKVKSHLVIFLFFLQLHHLSIT